MLWLPPLTPAMRGKRASRITSMKNLSVPHTEGPNNKVTGQEALPVCGCLPKRVKRYDENNPH